MWMLPMFRKNTLLPSSGYKQNSIFTLHYIRHTSQCPLFVRLDLSGPPPSPATPPFTTWLASPPCDTTCWTPTRHRVCVVANNTPGSHVTSTLLFAALCMMADWQTADRRSILGPCTCIGILTRHTATQALDTLSSRHVSSCDISSCSWFVRGDLSLNSMAQIHTSVNLLTSRDLAWSSGRLTCQHASQISAVTFRETWRTCLALFRRYQLFPELEEMLIEKVRQLTFLYVTKSPDYTSIRKPTHWKG
jgi:hypothetical protein